MGFIALDVATGAAKKTANLCVGIQDLSDLAGHAQSSEHRNAKDFTRKGQALSFLSEDDFWALAKIHSTGEIS